LKSIDLVVYLNQVPREPFSYAWQNECDDECSALLGKATMSEYNGMDCMRIDGVKMMNALFDPSEVEHFHKRMAALHDRPTYENCP